MFWKLVLLLPGGDDGEELSPGSPGRSGQVLSGRWMLRPGLGAVWRVGVELVRGLQPRDMQAGGHESSDLGAAVCFVCDLKLTLQIINMFIL